MLGADNKPIEERSGVQDKQPREKTRPTGVIRWGYHGINTVLHTRESLRSASARKQEINLAAVLQHKPDISFDPTGLNHGPNKKVELGVGKLLPDFVFFIKK